MKINVLMPVLATPVQWLKQAVESVIYQDHPNFNLIIVDDNNTVGPITEFLSDISKQHELIKVVRKEANEGIASALNFGIRHCNGDLIVRMDADDIAHVELLKSHDKYFSLHPDRHICGVQIRLFNEQRQWVSNHPLQITRSLASLMPGHWFVNHPGIAYRRSAINSIGGYNDTPSTLAEDYSLWVKFLVGGYTIYNMEEVLINYRVHPKSFSFAPDRKAPEWHEFLTAQKKLLDE